MLSNLEPLPAELYVVRITPCHVEPLVRAHTHQPQLKVDTVEAAVQGSLTFAPSSMTGYRAKLTPPDAAPLTWHIPDCAPLLKVGASFVFPRAVTDSVYYIVSFPGTCRRCTPVTTHDSHASIAPMCLSCTYTTYCTALTPRQLRRLELALDDFCSIFSAKEEDLTADEWAQQLQILANSSQYNSRVCDWCCGWCVTGV